MGDSSLSYCQFVFLLPVAKGEFIKDLVVRDFEVAKNDALAFCFCQNKLPQTCDLKQCKFISSQLCWSEVQMDLAELCLVALTKLKSSVCQSVLFFEVQRICLQAHSVWQNTVSCVYRAEVPIPLLAVLWDPLSAS